MNYKVVFPINGKYTFLKFDRCNNFDEFLESNQINKHWLSEDAWDEIKDIWSCYIHYKGQL